MDLMDNANKDHTIENILILDGERFVIDEKLGLWVKFEVKETSAREHGMRYSLTLHDREGNRLLGFDNAHEIEYNSKNKVAPLRTFDHFHNERGKTLPYVYKNAGKLLEDFWAAVEKYMSEL
jgi:hypothetical protein